MGAQHRISSCASRPLCRKTLTGLAPILPKGRPLSVVLETTGLDPLRDRIKAIALGCHPDNSLLLRICDEEDPKAVRAFLDDRPLILYDSATTSAFLRHIGVDPVVHGDPKLMAFVLDPTESLELGAIAQRYVGFDLKYTPAEDLEVGVLCGSSEELPNDNEEILARMASAVLRLQGYFSGRLGWASGLYEVELAIAPICADMRLTGIALSTPALQAVSMELDHGVAVLQTRLNAIYPNAGTNWH